MRNVDKSLAVKLLGLVTVASTRDIENDMCGHVIDFKQDITQQGLKTARPRRQRPLVGLADLIFLAD